MFTCINSTTIVGIAASIVSVEVDVGRGLPVFDMGGYLASEVKEAKERVRVAIRNSGYEWKPQRITVNLSPADVRKDGTGFDLPIALAILAANGEVQLQRLQHTIVIGELSLDGTVHPVKGILASICSAKQEHYTHCIIPKENVQEAACVEDMHIIGVRNLKEAVAYLNGMWSEEASMQMIPKGEEQISAYDFLDIHGQEVAKRATLVAASGMHNILYVGPPGCGKTMIAKRIPDILPELSFDERLELTKIYSIAGRLDGHAPMINKRPFRSPHHSITQTALIGGGRFATPGEITLAGKGVLFLDELTEYKSALLEALRQPLEDKKVTIARLHHQYSYPADFMLAAAMNPCRCGYYPDMNKCTCTKQEVARYLGRISRPLWDRFDICIQLNPVTIQEIHSFEKKEKSQSKQQLYTTKYMREQVERVRNIQQERFVNEDIHFNAEMNVGQIKTYGNMSAEAEALLERIYDKLQLTTRGYYKMIKTARTIADLEQSVKIEPLHVSEAVSYRSLI